MPPPDDEDVTDVVLPDTLDGIIASIFTAQCCPNLYNLAFYYGFPGQNYRLMFHKYIYSRAKVLSIAFLINV